MVKLNEKAGPRKVANRKATRALPHPNFPLFHHASGRWAKKVRGKLVYFGKVAGDPKGEAAATLWNEQKDDLIAGRVPRTKNDELTMGGLASRFRVAKEQQQAAGEITNRTLCQYVQTCDRLVEFFGKSRPISDIRTDDFEKLRADISKTCGLVSLGNEINRVRIVFKYGYDADLIAAPIKYGPTFKKAKPKVLRRAVALRRTVNGKMLDAAEIRKVLALASPHFKAMILLGINCGFGNADCGLLPVSAIDLDGGWIRYPRPKTGIDRRCKLWPETVEALKVAIAARKEPKDPAHADLAFLTRCRKPWHTDTSSAPISVEFSRLLTAAGIHRKGLGFYALRHTFETIGGETADQVAVNHVMGHADTSMAAVYRERISDERLIRVAEFVRVWLFSKPA